MRPTTPLAAPALALATALACGGNSSPPPTTTDAGTGTGGIPTCDASLKPVGTIAATAAQVEHLTPGAPAKVGTSLSFTVPPGTVSVTILEQAVSAPDAVTFDSGPLENTAVPLFVNGPPPTGGAGGELWYDDNVQTASPETQLAFFASSSPSTGTFTIPNTSAGLARLGTSFSGALPAGTWTLTVSDFAYECSLAQNLSICSGSGNVTSTYDVSVITKQAAGIPPAGVVDVTFHVVGTQTAAKNPARPLPALAADVANDPDIQRMVSTLKSIYAASGVTVREHFADVPADVQTRYSGLVNVDGSGACTPLSQLLKGGTPGDSIHLFLVNGFEATTGVPGGTVVAGVDGTIPGPATVGGTVASGAAVTTDNLRGGLCGPGDPVSYTACGDDLTALIAAHEMGHFLGLYHVTELNGAFFDPLGDTPRCACSTCRTSTADVCSTGPSGHAMALAECSGASAKTGCGGGDNLMFWFTPTTLKPLSAEQQAVVRANPQVQ